MKLENTDPLSEAGSQVNPAGREETIWWGEGKGCRPLAIHNYGILNVAIPGSTLTVQCSCYPGAHSLSNDAQSTSCDAQSTSRDAQSTSCDAQSTSRDAQSLSRDTQSLSRDAQSTSRDAQSLSRDAQPSCPVSCPSAPGAPSAAAETVTGCTPPSAPFNPDDYPLYCPIFSLLRPYIDLLERLLPHLKRVLTVTTSDQFIYVVGRMYTEEFKDVPYATEVFRKQSLFAALLKLIPEDVRQKGRGLAPEHIRKRFTAEVLDVKLAKKSK